jgi:hypothetical protein
VQRKLVSVDNMPNENPLNIAFHRTLTWNRWNIWLHLVQRLISVQLTNEKDPCIWDLTTFGTFTVKSMYLDLLDDDTKYHKKYIWKMKVPLKIKVFMWFLHRKVILTKDNLVKRNWTSNESCYLCDNKESIQHLFFECPLAKIIWRIVHMTFGLEAPKNVSNLSGNWLKGIPKKDLIWIIVGVCVVIWAIWNNGNYYILTNQKTLLYAGYLYGYALDPYVILSPTRGTSGVDGFWVGFIQLVWFGWRQHTRPTF